jgi:AcrR family transcriptional regulator
MQSTKLTRTQLARRDDIIAAAIRVINRDGYAAASIDRIAAEAGVHKSTVLYHFKYKQAINDAVIGTIFEDGAAYTGPLVVAARSYREKLRAYITSNLRYIAEHVEQITAIHQIIQNVGVGPGKNPAVAPLEQLLASGQAAGEFGTFNPHIVAVAIRSIIDGSAFHIVSEPDLDINDYAVEIAQVFEKATT